MPASKTTNMKLPKILAGRSPSIILGSYGNLLLPRAMTLNASEVASHKHVIGVTGQGKSKLLQSIFIQQLAQRLGTSLIDPHRDLARDILAHLYSTGFFASPDAYKRLIYIDFSLPRYVPFNVLVKKKDVHSTAYSFLEAVKRAWPSIADGTAPQLENILLAATSVLVECELPVTQMPELLSNKAYRDSLLTRVSDPELKNFFFNRYDRWSQASSMVESTLRRVFLLTFNPVLRHTLEHPENWLDFRKFMDEGTSVIYDLGGIDNPDARRLLGCLITVGYEMAALSRADIPGGVAARRQHHLILDEFAEFVAQSEEALSRMLALTRKYGLYLTLAHQTWSQASTGLRGALQNCGTEVVFRLGRADAELTAKALGRVDPYLVKDEAKTEYQRDSYMDLGSQWELWTQAIQDLPPRRALVRNGSRSAVRMKTVKVVDPKLEHSVLATVLQTYAEMYQRPAETPRASPAAPAQTPRSRQLWQDKRPVRSP